MILTVCSLTSSGAATVIDTYLAKLLTAILIFISKVRMTARKIRTPNVHWFNIIEDYFYLYSNNIG